MALSGRHVITAAAGEQVRAFVPHPLPPDPAVDLGRLLPALDRANQSVGRLDGAGQILPNPDLFVFMAVRKEALLSSQIEGTQSSLSDLLLFESSEEVSVPVEDVAEVSNYIAAMNHGLERLRGGFPLCLRLIREIHGVLLQGGRGEDKDPGEFRRSQNWIGGTRPGNAAFVPPPPSELMACLDGLEKFIQVQDSGLPLLVRIALVHAQFETIHPFLDGNGRLGRLLVTFMLCNAAALHAPLLYSSLYLKQNRAEYYDLLQAVRERAAWEPWIAFFLAAIAETADAGCSTIRQMMQIFAQNREKASSAGRQGRMLLMLLGLLERSPIVTIGYAAEHLSVSFPTASAAIRTLQEIGIVREMSGRERGRVFAYDAYLALLSEGMEPL